MKAGAADWFHNDLYEDEWQGGNEPDRWPTGLEGQLRSSVRPSQPKWLRRLSRLLRGASLHNSVSVVSRRPSFYCRLVEFFAVG